MYLNPSSDTNAPPEPPPPSSDGICLPCFARTNAYYIHFIKHETDLRIQTRSLYFCPACVRPRALALSFSSPTPASPLPCRCLNPLLHLSPSLPASLAPSRLGST